MKIISKNKAAYHNYEIQKNYEVWIVLKWFEVKSVKNSQVNIKDAIVRIDDRELRIVGMDIPLYSKTSPLLAKWYEPKGRRKLLITKKELTKISAMTDKPGNIIIPLEVFVSKTGFIKLQIGIAKLMRKVEKKQILKERDVKKQMDREIKNLK